MNKKLIVLIVALECVFSIFLISVFGPMLEMLHTPAEVSEIHVLDADGNRLERGAVIELERDARSYELSWEIVPDDADNPEVTVTAFVDDVEITPDTENPAVRITINGDGEGARITFRTKKPVRPVRITIAATDGSAVTTYVLISFKVDDTPSEIDPFQ